MGFLKNVFSLLLAAWLTSGTDAYGSEGSFESRDWADAMQVETNENPLGDMEDSQSSSSTESDKEMEEDDDSSSIQRGNSNQLATKINLIFDFQTALYKEHHLQVISPPPKS